MADTTSTEQSTVPRWRVVGPGLVVAATGVGAADLVATLIAGQKFGYTLLWCVVVGCVMKIVLVEGAGRYSLATGQTIFEGWRTLGRWTTWYFGPYIVVWGFVYGAAAMAGTGLALQGLLGGQAAGGGGGSNRAAATDEQGRSAGEDGAADATNRRRICREPSQVGLHLRDDGLWGGEPMTDEQKAAAGWGR